MRREGVIVAGVIVAGCASAQQRWLTPDERLEATGTVVEFALPHAASGPTTVALAPDGTVWFTESNGNRIGRMSPDGSDLTEFDVPTEESAPRIIALGADGNMWFSEHLSGQMARITPSSRVRARMSIPAAEALPIALTISTRVERISSAARTMSR